MKPFLRWAGSKRKLLPDLLKYWAACSAKQYVEPFMGSASLFFALQPRAAVLGDTNRELVETFESVRDSPRAVYDFLTSLDHTEETYYAVRDSRTYSGSPAKAAARFIFLNRLCFNGIYRTNASGSFNVPYSGEATGTFPTLEQLEEISLALQGATIMWSDFEDTISTATAGDFGYLDPPYSVANRRVFKQYGASVFGLSDLKRLSRSLVQLNNRGASFVLSYATCEEALRLFRRWKIQRRIVTRNVSGFAQHRRRAVELLVTNISRDR